MNNPCMSCAAKACGSTIPTGRPIWTSTTTWPRSAIAIPASSQALVAAGRDAQHPHALSARDRARLCRETARRPSRRALSQVMFTCTGSEANDLALRVARPSPAAPASSSPKTPITASPTRRRDVALARRRAARGATCGPCRRRRSPAGRTRRRLLRGTCAARSTTWRDGITPGGD